MENDQNKFFCGICDSVKNSNFCSKCNKKTPNVHKMKCTTGKYSLEPSLINLGIKRGDISWAYFPIAYGVILTIIIGIIQLVEIISWYNRVILIIFLGILSFYFCFFNDSFRRKIVWLFQRSKEHIEK